MMKPAQARRELAKAALQWAAAEIWADDNPNLPEGDWEAEYREQLLDNGARQLVETLGTEVVGPVLGSPLYEKAQTVVDRFDRWSDSWHRGTKHGTARPDEWAGYADLLDAIAEMRTLLSQIDRALELLNQLKDKTLPSEGPNSDEGPQGVPKVKKHA